MRAKTKWVLLVDDEADIRDSVRELLRLSFGEKDLKIVESPDGVDATTKVKNQKFDCIITDMKMPKKEGDALIASVRQNAFNVETPVIMLTAFPKEKVLRDHRFIYLMEKPFLHNELTELVSNQLKLGSSGDRLAADMVNNLIEAAQSFFSTIYKTEDFALETPLAKRCGEEISFDHVSQVSLHDEGVVNSFYLLINDDGLDRLSDEVDGLKDKPRVKVALALGQSILKFAMKGASRRRGLTYSVNSLDVESGSVELMEKRGIVIPFLCNGIQLRVFACAEKKGRIKAS